MAPAVESSNTKSQNDSRKTNKEKPVHDIHKGEHHESGSGTPQQISNPPVVVRPDEFDYLHAAPGAFKCALCRQWHTKRCPWLINY
ncbi:hypothetical protein BO83DRAFT_422684 [Aspergillus eucalypticola CBS 122712]|uniref:Uncharacterized protein n=1 Tax=Aspergillus eucalypticola (strain CBS 122712 / IBT 29274) TaxID=1448314 RepID=A0A317WC46_ASPEC|nr:uncharacterized protein BO83DRAFT_422684 [Aspergillus eucalypticola CBS 122712]PWY84034.1 hypothetical protein BO83DRAFT_422684 [Aspergillus eucalypticola CBS 122712]